MAQIQPFPCYEYGDGLQRRMLENETGQDMFDRYAMTIDERPFFDEHIAQALLALLHSFRRHCTGLQPITTEATHAALRSQPA